MARGSVSVSEVIAGSPAEAAGLKKGQVINAVDNQTIRTPSDFYKAIVKTKGPVTLHTDQGEVTVK